MCRNRKVYPNTDLQPTSKTIEMDYATLVTRLVKI